MTQGMERGSTCSHPGHGDGKGRNGFAPPPACWKCFRLTELRCLSTGQSDQIASFAFRPPNMRHWCSDLREYHQYRASPTPGALLEARSGGYAALAARIGCSFGGMPISRLWPAPPV